MKWHPKLEVILRHEEMELLFVGSVFKQLPFNHLELSILKNVGELGAAPIVDRPNDDWSEACCFCEN